MPSSITLTAPAKINLGLEVLRRRADGYHDLNTVFAALAFGDTVTLTARDDDRITCTMLLSNIPADGTNLAVRAAQALRASREVQYGLDIVIEKRIPAGAGLGGGSSDAAAVLMGAPTVWAEAGVNGTWNPSEIADIALSLGSDVPFFLRGGMALAGSRGEVLTPVDLDLPFSVLLVNPGVHVPTPMAFASLERVGERRATDLVAALRSGVNDAVAMRHSVVNDFELAIFAMHPELELLKDKLYETGAHFALMSGSGSTLYGLFRSTEEATRAQREFGGFWTEVAGFAGSGQD